MSTLGKFVGHKEDKIILKGLTLISNTQDYCVLGLCPSSGILYNQRTQRFGNWICFRNAETLLSFMFPRIPDYERSPTEDNIIFEHKT
jgi:hypothetical protein